MSQTVPTKRVLYKPTKQEHIINVSDFDPEIHADLPKPEKAKAPEKDK